ncbi:calcium-dependent protein kinase 21 [Reticulomyxa filosa]|uniref:Calcium-dependent protein kinase 21 n=1 Tax=Reticulomyxa filosa TaxID=46433 RepID=X6MUI2_RETFI|nr:calcium-dependent protein kinase 21 [Reticulomyxa filosa]|eukprot:ETO17107.1 calcium-dependent protein kinase 21 [Reticulomyxa filosa]
MKYLFTFVWNKTENFVFEGKEADSNIVLIDFGCAKEIQDDEVYDDLVGTVYYLAPELASQKKDVPTTGLVLKFADVWSVGVITYVMLTGRPPFGGKSNREIFQRIVKYMCFYCCFDPLLFPDDVKLSDAFKDFVRQTLVKDPSKRITLEAALQHPWVLGKDASETELQKDVIRYLRQFNYQSKLKKAITRCLAANMSKEPEQEVKRHFNRLDKDGDGFLELNELEQFLFDLGYAPSIAKEEAKKMLANADLNKDGTIDFNEFKAVWQRKLLTQHEEYIHRVFAVFDDNGDGYIDASELQGVLGDDFKSILEMISEVDENHDNKISFEEFKKAMKEDVSKLEDGLAGAGKIREQDLA